MVRVPFFATLLLLLACCSAPATKQLATTDPAPVAVAPAPRPTTTVQQATTPPPLVSAPKPVNEQDLPPEPEKPVLAVQEKPAVAEDQPQAKPSVPMAVARSHAAFDSLLQKYVSGTGQVNYKGLKADSAGLQAYCRLLAENPPRETWSQAEKLAYWINVYNAFTMKLIVDNYPTASILRFDGGKTWDVKRITLGGKKYSLNQIENEIIRPQFKEPRIHFALNCAAKSCPPLYNRAYTAENLEDALESRAKQFINHTGYNSFSAGKAVVSKIFDWYGADFGDLKKYLNRYADTPIKASAMVSFKEYDWDLNE